MTTALRPWTPDPSLVREVEARFEGAIASYRANPHLISEHANHEESIRVGGYANRTLLELVQNAADAMSGTGGGAGDHAGRVEIVLDMDCRTLYCANAGRSFSSSGITAITHAHLSGKRGDEIGRFGLGFKSVLAVSDAPQVFSRSVSFEFNSSAAQAAVAGVTEAAKRRPILRTPTVTDPYSAFSEDPILEDLSRWAATIVRLPDASNLERLREEIRNFHSEFLLFVGDVRHVELRVLGAEPFRTSHSSRDLGDGVFRIEGPDGGGDEWIVADRMHEPSVRARQLVGEAVSRSEVKVTVAVPRRQARQRVGRFWSYFPLQDRTSASALFNAPWSVNDDRTTLLENDYNREILTTVAGMFVDLLPRLTVPEDPAAHLDYMPARGRELLSFGDRVLCAHVPVGAGHQELVPDATGTLRSASLLRPLDFAFEIDAGIHEAWAISPNTEPDVPHWSCYSSRQRFLRLRQLFAASVSGERFEDDDRSMKRALDTVAKRGLLSWLREWAEGDDDVSAANAFRFVVGNRRLPDVDLDQAKVVPTSSGMRTMADHRIVFLHQEEGVEIESAIFVRPGFLGQPEIETKLRAVGFRDLDPQAILNARLARLSAGSSDDQYTKLWDAVLGVPVREALSILVRYPGTVKVPTLDGGWAWPGDVFDLDEPLGADYASRSLDRRRCLPEVARGLGVVHKPVRDYALESEPFLDEYRDWVVSALDEDRASPGTAERLEFFPGRGAGPVSALFILKEVGASDQIRERWTVELLGFEGAEWSCEDLDTGRTHPVRSPVQWAVERAGLVRSNRGFRAPTEVVAPSLVKYEKLLPLFTGPRAIVDALHLPDELDSVPAPVLRTALEAELFPSNIDDSVLVEFVTAACRIAYPGAQPPSIPAKVGRAIESRSPGAVYVATTDEQDKFLAARQRPYLRTTEARAVELVNFVGCRRFEDSFAFSMVLDGVQESERVLDVFTGLRSTHVADRLTNATIAMALQVVKRVTTEDGLEDQSLPYHLDGLNLVVQDAADERRQLRIVNEAFDLRLTAADLDTVRKAGVDRRLEELRLEASAAATDEDRLEVYFGPDDLREALPRGCGKRSWRRTWSTTVPRSRSCSGPFTEPTRSSCLPTGSGRRVSRTFRSNGRVVRRPSPGSGRWGSAPSTQVGAASVRTTSSSSQGRCGSILCTSSRSRSAGSSRTCSHSGRRTAGI
ncbi:sacsin N-terminal ATP-binding-like domain-containing protein [Catenulispora yoronensis]